MIDDFKSYFLGRLAQLLESRGIAERERTLWLKTLLGIDLSSANRKLKGGIAFNIEELAKVSRAVSCSSDYLLGLKDEASATRPPGHAFDGLGVRATLDCDRLPAQDTMTVAARHLGDPDEKALIAWISRNESALNAQVVAWKPVGGSGWKMAERADAPSDATLHRVYARLALDPAISAYRIAVLDDRAETAEVMQGFLEQAGYIADTYTRTDELAKALRQTRYDAFVLDWSMGRGETTESLMEDIRQNHAADTPIILITGEASELEIERAIDRHGVRYFQKTGLFKPIIAQLKKDLRELA
ncbi:response regulator [Chromobacterium subtsugae]|uniref:Response regulator n=1 Tax=Chromobacterium subtsugae TaxID=251747 RepID=A0ABS7FDV0_9NEIS|nr:MULTISPECIES: helix-turn-helix domain-containing protein [Chromobacterium]KUM04764.1 hypothetical protein Cv017_12660 [Chromobacterium subtsugae]KZE87431.1 hypothetical protein AWB61_11185 [Chromobacterium sp. F49]MBW7566576.1 response regulator [Chromobacterium subtsugae]MBW8288263.1 response regulator [Chromobacterium subtsugae]WSE92158.1 helix-turn-helix domain-containing protein [Chromobacterium subtsugae]